MCRWTRESPLNSGSHPGPDKRTRFSLAEVLIALRVLLVCLILRKIFDSCLYDYLCAYYEEYEDCLSEQQTNAVRVRRVAILESLHTGALKPCYVTDHKSDFSVS